MLKRNSIVFLLLSVLLISNAPVKADGPQEKSISSAAPIKPGRAPNQPIDEEYSKKIREYTTEPFFLSPLVEYLPASKTVPTPKAVLGDIAGAPGKLPYSMDVYRYMRMLEKATPRVKVFSIGTTEEGREMIAVAVSSEANMSKLEENRARLAKLADPRTINMNDDEAERLVAASTPVYYITGTIHSPETGAPTALMELAYRLAVDESPYIKSIRDGIITLITPIVEVDGRDRQVDVYNWHLAHPNENWPPLVYWGHYVAHDNNRDAMGVTLKLTRNVLNTFTSWKAQVLHDLHESVPYLYDNTVGDGPYNAWLDPILTDEWQMLGWHNVSEMTKFGMPGVFTHGTFDTWSPGYLMFIAAMHNGISRLYETFGNGGADTVERTLSPNEYSRTWYRQNPPLPRVKWSQRNNNNYEQTALLTTLHYFSENSKLFLKNFYLKSKRSIEKPKTSGPAAYVFPADDPRPGAQAELLRILQAQGCEISRATAPFTVTVKKKKLQRAPDAEAKAEAQASNQTRDASQSPPSNERQVSEQVRAQEQRQPASQTAGQDRKMVETTETRQFPAGSYIVRMDQPYSRIADALLDYQYWSPNDPQKNVYDDTGWTFGELGNVQVMRVTDVNVLNAPMERVAGEVRAPGRVKGSGSIFIVNHNTDNTLITLRYRLKDATFDVAEEPFEAAGQKFNRGSFIIRNVSQADLDRAVQELSLTAFAVSDAPSVKTHAVKAPRIAIMHTWLATQDEGWWRMAFDQLNIPYDYISTQTAAKESDLRSKYDVIIFAPVGRGNPIAIVEGMPTWGNPLPWKKTELTPNLGRIDSTDDMRPGLGWSGVANLQAFVRKGGLFITSMDTTNFAVSLGFAPGVSIQQPQRLKVTGSILRAKFVDSASPIAYGYGDKLSIYCYDGPIFNVSNIVGGGRGRRRSPEDRDRPTGRGTVDDPDYPQDRAPVELPEEPHAEVWEALPVTDEQRRNGIFVIPPEARPRVVLRYGDNRDLLVSGLLDAGNEIAQHAAVIDVPLGGGHVVLFSNNPVWRGETQGSYFLVFNAILNFDNLNAGRKLDEK
ncbi:MAG TPA: M14 family zinc carboxypeptidase [Blastocatellia bacterium]|nr:M14 family zinc carboxypeptidase [Blastocatellia bacterium]